jgi:hypothetical protein
MIKIWLQVMALLVVVIGARWIMIAVEHRDGWLITGMLIGFGVLIGQWVGWFLRH